MLRACNFTPCNLRSVLFFRTCMLYVCACACVCETARRRDQLFQFGVNEPRSYVLLLGNLAMFGRCCCFRAQAHALMHKTHTHTHLIGTRIPIVWPVCCVRLYARARTSGGILVQSNVRIKTTNLGNKIEFTRSKCACRPDETTITTNTL